MDTSEYNAVTVGKMLVTPDQMILRVRTDEPRQDFMAGQYTVLGLYGKEARSPNSYPEKDRTPDDKLIMRPYSIASANTQTQEFEFYIGQVKSGQLTPRLFNLEMGGRLHVGKRIIGVFTLADTPPDVDVVMVATGTGLAPYVSFLRSHVASRPQTKMVVIHGAAHSWDLGYYSELNFLAQVFSNFYYLPTLTQADENWTGYRLWIEDMIKTGVLEKESHVEIDPEKTHFFLCGNPKMVANLTELLTTYNYTRHSRKNPGSLHIEEFK
ncbi:MAG: ferredoxin--NADP reductase [Anaerolineales bacterium]|nr:ferredoxin--NADP reductase [Anaerolineales bacterium]